jgi:DNA-binding response OmpR family regulator
MRVLVVEDMPRHANRIAEGLRDQGIAVDVAYDGLEADAKLRLNPYDVVLLDRDLPGIHGDRLCQIIIRSDDPPMVLMLTAAGGPDDRVKGLALGADDYLAKPFHFEEVLARVRALSRRRVAPLVQVLQAGNLSMDSAARQVMVGGDVVPTTRREYELLELFLRHPAQVLSKEQIHDAVWGDAQTVESGLVEVYAGKVRRKLQAARASVLIETCRGIGYRLISGEAAAL